MAWRWGAWAVAVRPRPPWPARQGPMPDAGAPALCQSWALTFVCRQKKKQIVDCFKSVIFFTAGSFFAVSMHRKGRCDSRLWCVVATEITSITSPKNTCRQVWHQHGSSLMPTILLTFFFVFVGNRTKAFSRVVTMIQMMPLSAMPIAPALDIEASW